MDELKGRDEMDHDKPFEEAYEEWSLKYWETKWKFDDMEIEEMDAKENAKEVEEQCKNIASLMHELDSKFLEAPKPQVQSKSQNQGSVELEELSSDTESQKARTKNFK